MPVVLLRTEPHLLDRPWWLLQTVNYVNRSMGDSLLLPMPNREIDNRHAQKNTDIIKDPHTEIRP